MGTLKVGWAGTLGDLGGITLKVPRRTLWHTFKVLGHTFKVANHNLSGRRGRMREAGVHASSGRDMRAPAL